ncbi:MAG: beta-N-acetylhexosaminidase [Spirochaetales bacterium]|nr:beta-N-acetylhexosaminidase [Spirochaetales bacterium]
MFKAKNFIAILFFLLSFSCVSHYSAQPQRIAVVPQPQLFELVDGKNFILTNRTNLINLTESSVIVDHLNFFLSNSSIQLRSDVANSANVIVLQYDPKLEAGHYLLEINESIMKLVAADDLGLFYATQTLFQVMPHELWWEKNNLSTVRLPCLKIEDFPNFPWRGLHIDSSRHFFPKETILKMLDAMAVHKLNRLHWHLTDDQGWRVEIKKYPKLTEIGAFRKRTRISHLLQKPYYEDEVYGGFYTQEDLREIVEYANQRFITIVPEIDVPGHSAAIVASYPEFGNFPEKQIDVRTTWGISSDILNPSAEVQQVIFDIFDEIMDIFPGEYIHIGGDEAPLTQWMSSDLAKNMVEEGGFSNFHQLYYEWIDQLVDYLEAKGKRVLGWEEIFNDNTSPEVIIMPWFSTSKAIPAAANGNKVLNVYRHFTYFDYKQEYSATEPLGIGGFLPMKKVYEFDPIPSGTPQELRKNFIGSQGQLWSEYIRSSSHLEYMAFPRLSALSEVLWTNKSLQSWELFLPRIEAHYQRLAARDIDYRVYKPSVKLGSLDISSTKTATFYLEDKISGRGSYQFVLDKGIGSPVEISKVELLRDSANLDADIHDSITGSLDIFNIYTFHVNDFKPSNNYKLLIHFKPEKVNGYDNYENSGKLNIYMREQKF